VDSAIVRSKFRKLLQCTFRFPLWTMLKQETRSCLPDAHGVWELITRLIQGTSGSCDIATAGKYLADKNETLAPLMRLL